MPLCLSLLVASTSAAFAQGGMGKKEEIHMVLYKIYKQQGKSAEAEKEVAAITALNPNNGLIHSDWGRVLTGQQHFKQAIPHWLKATKIDGTNGDNWAQLGDCYMQTAAYGAALSAYKNAVQYARQGVDYRSRYQIAQQYIQHQQQEIHYKEQQKKQKEDSDE